MQSFNDVRHSSSLERFSWHFDHGKFWILQFSSILAAYLIYMYLDDKSWSKNNFPPLMTRWYTIGSAKILHHFVFNGSLAFGMLLCGCTLCVYFQMSFNGHLFSFRLVSSFSDHDIFCVWDLLTEAVDMI